MKRLVITIEGDDAGDVEIALEEVARLVGEGYTSGFNDNETGAFHFDLDECADAKQLAW